MHRHSDATLMGMTKKELVAYVRMAEHNYDVAREQLHQQAENVKDWVPVVRCKDCKHSAIDACTNRLVCARCGEIRPNGHVWGGSSTLPENFCSYGERKDNESVVSEREG